MFIMMTFSIILSLWSSLFSGDIQHLESKETKEPSAINVHGEERSAHVAFSSQTASKRKENVW